MKLTRFVMLVAVAGAIQAQSWDTSGNGLLEGQYYFRQVSYDVSDKYGDLGGEIGIYGNITFDGNGKYSMTGQYNIAGEAVTFSGALTANGTYSIAASGYGFISSPCFDPESGPSSADLRTGVVAGNLRRQRGRLCRWKQRYDGGSPARHSGANFVQLRRILDVRGF
jgi:hypothetical protein